MSNFKINEINTVSSRSRSSGGRFYPKNTLIISVLSDQEFIITEDNYLTWIEVTCFKNDKIKVVVDDIIIFTSNIYNNDTTKKSITLIGVDKFISKHSSLKMTSKFPLNFRLHFTNIKENLEKNIKIVKERDLTREEYEDVFNNNNYIDLLEQIFD